MDIYQRINSNDLISAKSIKLSDPTLLIAGKEIQASIDNFFFSNNQKTIYFEEVKGRNFQIYETHNESGKWSAEAAFIRKCRRGRGNPLYKSRWTKDTSIPSVH